MFCSNCGKGVGDTDTTCSHCSKPTQLSLDHSYQSVVRDFAASISEAESNRKVLYWALGILCLIGLFVYFTDANDPPTEYTAMEELCDRLAFRLQRNQNFYGQCMTTAEGVMDDISKKKREAYDASENTQPSGGPFGY